MVDSLMRLIKHYNKNNKITLFLDKRNHQLSDYFEFCDHTIVMPSKGNKYLFLIRYGLKYRKNKYDIGIAAKVGTGSTGSIFLYALGAKKRISYTRGNFTDILINYKIPYNESIFHEQHYVSGLLGLLTANTDTPIPKNLYPKLLYNSESTTTNPSIFISVTNTNTESQLTNKKYKKILAQLSKNHHFSVTISAHPNDYITAYDLSSIINVENRVVISESLDILIDALASSDLCLLGDGGLVHMAAALNIPMVALYPRMHDALKTWIPLCDKFNILKNHSNVNNISTTSITSALSDMIN